MISAPHEVLMYREKKNKEHDNADNIMRSDYCKVPENYRQANEVLQDEINENLTMENENLSKTPTKKIKSPKSIFTIFHGFRK